MILGILILYNSSRISRENFEDQYDTLETSMNGASGFYSQIWCNLRHYLYAKKHGLNYILKTTNWHYTLDKGWEDYFENVDIITNNPSVKTLHPGIFDILKKYSVKDYIAAIPEFYRPNDDTIREIARKKGEIGFRDNIEYGAIYIRRGDKLINEIDLVESSEFINKLLKVYPNCKKIFLQTDDYNCYLELHKYIDDNKLNIEIRTLCPPGNFGAVSDKNWMNRLKTELENNKDSYLQNVKNNLSKSIAEMSPAEKKEHVLELMTSVDICCGAQYVVCDYRSNVARFIKCAHKIDTFRVFDVKDGDSIFSLDNKSCPCFNFKK